MARTRVILGTSLVVGFLGLLALDSLLADGPLFHVLVAVVLVGALLEFYALAERDGRRPLKVLPALLVVAFVAGDLAVRRAGGALDGWLGYDPSDLARFYTPMGLGVAVALSLIVVAHVVARGQSRWLADAPTTSLGLLYVWFLGAHTFAIRDVGVSHLLVFIATAKLGDAGAYFVGRAWGRHKLAPRVSPGKTVEGALGGLATSVAMAVLVAGACGLVSGPDTGAVKALARGAVFGLSSGSGFWVLFGLLVGAAAQVGDLVESALKRSAGVKDSGRLFPQFGGVLDMVDSLLLSAPVAFWLLVLR